MEIECQIGVKLEPFTKIFVNFSFFDEIGVKGDAKAAGNNFSIISLTL